MSTAPDGPAVDEAVRTLLLLMPRLVGRAKRLPVPQALQGFDLAPRHLALLAHLEYDGPASVNELAARLEVVTDERHAVTEPLERSRQLDHEADSTSAPGLPRQSDSRHPGRRGRK